MPKGDPKAKSTQHRELAETYKINFEYGPIDPTRWPSQHAETFHIIDEIRRLRYEEYGPNEKRAALAVVEMKDRVARLNRTAQSCRKQLENEATWRGLTEPDIISRFAAEVACRTCDKWLWDSEFKTLPDDPTEATKLQQNRARRTMCNCSLETKAAENVAEDNGAQLFVSRFQTRFVPDPTDRLEVRLAGAKSPDRVIGLRYKEVFRQPASALEGLRLNPFADGNVLFPFLIIEAKSEKGSPGFESIEHQAAFPIRALSKLQHDLSRASRSSIKPLVWFLANQGDEWRVYGSVLDDSKWRVMDLWHGSILSRQSTLQLLLIMDYICDWARDIYCVSIRNCLSSWVQNSEDLDMQDTTPSYTNFQSQPEPLDSGANPPSIPTPRANSPEAPRLTNLNLDAPRDDTEMEDISPVAKDDASSDSSNGNEDVDVSNNSSHSNEDFDMGPVSVDENGEQPLLRFSSRHNDSKHWTNHATIRHSDLVLFSFRHVAVPEDRETLRAWLNPSKTTDCAAQQNMLLSCLIQETNAVTITMNGVLQLENKWTGTNDETSSEHDTPVLVWIWFQSYFRTWDWQVVRELICLTVSMPAYNELIAVADIPWSLLPDQWIAHEQCPCLTTDAESLRSLCGKESVVSTVSNLVLRLQSFPKEDGQAHLRWEREPNKEDPRAVAESHHLWKVVSSRDRLNASRPGSRSSELLEELLPGKVMPPLLGRAVGIDILGCASRMCKEGAILLLKPASWPISCPKFCLLVLNETDFEDEPHLGRMLVLAANRHTLHMPGRNGTFESRALPTLSELPAIKLWADILYGLYPADTEWPQ